MAKEQSIPPIHVPVYLESVPLGLQQVAEVKSTAVYSVLDTGYKNPAEPRLQQWWIDPSEEEESQFFVHLNDSEGHPHVLQSPEQDGYRCFINEQGDRTENGGIQVWIFESIGDPTNNVWRLRNFKTNFYLYLDGKAGETGIPIIALRYPPLESNVEWKVDVE